MHLSLLMLNVGGIFKDVGVGQMEPTSTSERQPRRCSMSLSILCEAYKSRPPEQRTLVSSAGPVGPGGALCILV